MSCLGLDEHGTWTTTVGFGPETGEVVRLKRVPKEPRATAAAFSGRAGPLHGMSGVSVLGTEGRLC
jgi:hypothetical protein